MKEIAGLVPQMFYDLIGRFIPGVMLLALGALLFVDLSTSAPLPSLAVRLSTTGLVSIGVVLAYSLGALLGGLGFALVNREWTTRPVATVVAEVPANLSLAHLTEGQISFLYDAVRFYNPAAGARLVKLRAEQHMCSVLFAGSIVLLGICGLVDRAPSSPISSVVAVAMLVSLAGSSYLLYVHLAVRARRLLVNYCQLLPELSETISPAGRRQDERVANTALEPSARGPVA